MGRWTARETWMCVGAVILALTIAYYTGKKQGAADEKLAENAAELKKSDANTKTVSAQVDTAHKHSSILTVYRDRVRAKVTVQHDTVKVADSVVAVSPQIAQLIQADDSTIAAQARTIALQDTLIASLRVGITLRDERIHLLESRNPSRFSKGFQVGAGYCQSPTGQTPCIYAGYGAQVRLP